MKMAGCSTVYCVTMVMITLMAVTAKETVVNMDKSADNQCGKVFVLAPSHDVRLKSTGLAPKGYCGVSVFTPAEVNNFTCDAICVTYKTASVGVCDVKVKFVGHQFGKSGDLVREFSCHKRDTSSFCWKVSSIRVEVIESYNYAYEEMRPHYEFDVDVSATCTKDPRSDVWDSNRERLEDDEHQTFVEGIAVGVSLACVFLIVLFVAWCYTKHQAVSSSPSDIPSHHANTHRKGNLISTFRKKLNIRRKTPQDNMEPEAIYRKTDMTGETKTKSHDPETAPLTREPEAETFELANETIDAAKEGSTGEDSPKDGGAEAAKLDTPEVVINPATPEPELDSNE